MHMVPLKPSCVKRINRFVIRADEEIDGSIRINHCKVWEIEAIKETVWDIMQCIYGRWWYIMVYVSRGLYISIKPGSWGSYFWRIWCHVTNAATWLSSLKSMNPNLLLFWIGQNIHCVLVFNLLHFKYSIWCLGLPYCDLHMMWMKWNPSGSGSSIWFSFWLDFMQ